MFFAGADAQSCDFERISKRRQRLPAHGPKAGWWASRDCCVPGARFSVAGVGGARVAGAGRYYGGGAHRGGYYGGGYRGNYGGWGYGLAAGAVVGGLLAAPYYGGGYYGDSYAYDDGSYAYGNGSYGYGGDCYIGRQWVIDGYGRRVLRDVQVCN